MHQNSPCLPVLWAYRLAGEIGIACVCIAMRHQIPEPMPKSYVDAANERNTVTFAESLLINGLLKQKRKSINYVYSARARARDSCARACTVLLLVLVRIQCSCSCVYSANMTITNKQNDSYNYQFPPHNKNQKINANMSHRIIFHQLHTSHQIPFINIWSSQSSAQLAHLSKSSDAKIISTVSKTLLRKASDCTPSYFTTCKGRFSLWHTCK